MNKAYCRERIKSGFIGMVSLYLFILLLLIIFLIYLSRQTDCLSVFGQKAAEIYSFVSQHAWVLIISLLFLPTFGIPISPLLVIAGAFWGIRLGLIISFMSIGFNLIFSYFFYKNCFNRVLFKLIFRNKPLPEVIPASRLKSLRWVILIQLIPQIPYTAQCYILSTLKEVNFWHYLSISWMVQFLWAVGFICAGQAILSGQWGLTIFCLILVAIYLTYKGFVYYKKLDDNSC